MQIKDRLFTHKGAGALAAIVIALVIPASASAAVTVHVTPTPASLPAPGGNVQYTINVNSSNPAFDFCFDCINGAVESLTDSVYGDLNGRGTCSVSPATPRPIPYACAFSAPVSGSAGTVVANATLAGWVSGHTGGPFPPDPNHYVRGSAAGAGAVLLTAPPAPPEKKCKKGFILKKVKTKNGIKKKCVKKKK